MNEIINQILNISNKDLDNIDTTYIDETVNFNSSYYHLRTNSGREHYRLLMYISSLFSNQILFDIGTNECRSAISLAYNAENKVKSYDITQILPANPSLKNVEYIIGDSTRDGELINSPFIFLDVDHDGIYENVFYDHLLEIKWRGILVLDDIHLNEPMKAFWDKINKQKFDITQIGHWSGTGLVIFD